jgi:hypothetical protein
MTKTAIAEKYDHDYWDAQLAGQEPRFHDGKPQLGRYELFPNRQPVAIFLAEDALIITVNGAVIDPSKHSKTWLGCGKHAVTEEAYDARMATGFWPGEKASAIEALGNYTHNAPPPTKVVELLPYTIDRVADWLEKQGDALTDATAKLAVDAKQEVDRVRLLADKERQAVSKPLYDQFTAANELYNPNIKAAVALTGKIDAALRKLASAKAEESRKAAAEEAAKAQAEAQALLAEAAKAEPEKAAEAIAQATAKLTEAAQAAAAPIAPVRFVSSTGKGRAVTAKEVWAVTVTDWDSVYKHFAGDHRVRELLQDLATKAINAGQAVPGTTKTAA